MLIQIKFRNDEQKQFFYHKERDGHFGGGFGNGKTYVMCQRAFVHLATFSNYGMVLARLKFKILKATTMKTFWKICPKELVFKHDESDGYTVLINKSFIFWMHLDAVDEDDVKGLETNSAGIDQAEEIEENIANILSARVGRWDQAKVPNYLLLEKVDNQTVKDTIIAYQNENAFKNADKISELLFEYSRWPKDPFGERFRVPNYFDTLSNPADEGEFHWTYRLYHPSSRDRIPNSFHIERQTQDELNDPGSINRIKSKDPEFIDRYYYGKVGNPRAIIHNLNNLSIIRPSNYTKEQFEDFIKELLRRGSLTRLLDHGDTGVTAAGWEGTLKFHKDSLPVHIMYREYYETAKLISYHRTEITNFSSNPYGIEEIYQNDLADPAIFKNSGQNRQSFYTIADEYSDTEGEIDAPAIYWSKADNNEYATRNRINELFSLSEQYRHPITGETPAPGFYFIEADQVIYPYGVKQAIVQTRNQRRILLGSINGKNIYSEERDEKIADHSYDLVRYDVAEHNTAKTEKTGKKMNKRSFNYFNALLKANPEFLPASSEDYRIYGPGRD